MGQAPDVLVIGGGIIGLTAAYELAKAGLRVEVCDRGDLGREASWAGAGIIPPGNPDRAATPADRLRGLGSAGFPGFSAELRERTGVDNGYVRCGGVEFLGDDAADVLSLWTDEGIAFRPVRDDLEPGIRPPTGTDAYLLPDCAQVRNPWHLRAVEAAGRQLGITLAPHRGVAGWVFDAGRVVGVRFEDGTSRAAGRYLVASGAWAEGLLDPLDCRPGVHPVRGQIVLYHPPAPLFRRVLMAGKRYLVPRQDGRVLVGSTEEPEAGFRKESPAESLRVLSAFARGLVPALADCPVEKTWCGLRPGSPDGRPFIGYVPGHDNLLVAAGHFRAGVQLSIGTAALVTALILGREPPVDPAAFRPDRVPDLTAPAAFRS